MILRLCSASARDFVLKWISFRIDKSVLIAASRKTVDAGESGRKTSS